MGNDGVQSAGELRRALECVPAYASWRAADPGPGMDVDARYAALPTTTKSVLGELAPRGFAPNAQGLEQALANGSAELVQTSGTTGKPTTLVWSQSWWNASERASWALNATALRVTRTTPRMAVLASPRCVGPAPGVQPLPVAARTLGGTLFLNEHPDVALWSPDDIRRMHGELWELRPALLEADSAYLAAFCARLEHMGLQLPEPDILVFTYGLPSRIHLARIQRLLPVPVASSYGSTETGYVLMSCTQGRMHLNRDSCRVDIAPLRSDPHHLGKMVVTPFGHPHFSLLRFEVNDLVRRATTPCTCDLKDGLQFERVEGRLEDTTLDANARPVPVAELDDAMADAAPECVVAYQVTQLGPARYSAQVTSTQPFPTTTLRARLARLYGTSAQVEVAVVDRLGPEASGKYRLARTGFPVARENWFLPPLEDAAAWG